MNNPHKTARTTLLGRAETIRRIVEEHRPVAEMATRFGDSKPTVYNWPPAGGQTVRRALRAARRGNI